MKLTFASLLLLLIGCKGTEKKASQVMPGAYQMLSVAVKSSQSDSTYTNQHQLKIYTGDHMMYANINSPDSISGFGIGSYTAAGDTITENIIYNANDSVSNDQPEKFKLYIQNTEKGYSQFIGGMKNNAGDQFDLTELYESVGTSDTTVLDGAWKQVKNLYIKGKDTSSNTPTQYKTYFSGYCIWGNAWKDSLNKMHTGIGYGKFTMPSANKVKESMMASTYAIVRGHNFDIDIELLGKDGFKQTTINPDGSINVEIYERLK